MYLKGSIDKVLGKMEIKEEIENKVVGIEGELKELMAIFCSNS